MAVSDEVAVLRKGKYIGTVKTERGQRPQSLTDMMVGRAVSPEHRPARTPSTPKPRLDGARA